MKLVYRVSEDQDDPIGTECECGLDAHLLGVCTPVLIFASVVLALVVLIAVIA